MNSRPAPRPQIGIRLGGSSPPLPMRQALTGLVSALRVRALRLARNEAIADDLVQDTIERALRFESSFVPGTNLRAWLHQILFSVFVTRCRRQRRERRALDALTTDPCAWPHRDSGPEMRSLTPRVEGALQDLPESFASVIRLVDIGELSYKDAAAVLDVPVGTVMSRLFRGRRLLASVLRDPPRMAKAA
jgi:RNA polymerase sigma-70 factor (ECF subfamily)